MWTFIIQIAMRLIGSWLDANEKRREAKESFLRFVATLEEKQLLSVSLNKQSKKQLDELMKEEP